MKIEYCPFCGNTQADEFKYEDTGYWTILCPSCNSQGPVCVDVEEAYRSWNKRAEKPLTLSMEEWRKLSS